MLTLSVYILESRLKHGLCSCLVFLPFDVKKSSWVVLHFLKLLLPPEAAKAPQDVGPGAGDVWTSYWVKFSASGMDTASSEAPTPSSALNKVRGDLAGLGPWSGGWSGRRRPHPRPCHGFKVSHKSPQSSFFTSHSRIKTKSTRWVVSTVKRNFRGKHNLCFILLSRM